MDRKTSAFTNIRLRGARHALALLVSLGMGCTTQEQQPHDAGRTAAKDAAPPDTGSAAAKDAATGTASQTPAAGPWECPADVPKPDAGTDACFACVLEHCCGGGAGECVYNGGDWLSASSRHNVSNCYVALFGAVRDCYAQKLTSGATAAGWYIAADCVDESFAALEGHPPFPYGTDLGVSALVECVIGTFPAADDADGGGTGTLPAADDADGGGAGTRTLPTYLGHKPKPASCAPECFPGWR